VALLQKITCYLRHPMSLRHPVCVPNTSLSVLVCINCHKLSFHTCIFGISLSLPPEFCRYSKLSNPILQIFLVSRDFRVWIFTISNERNLRGANCLWRLNLYQILFCIKALDVCIVQLVFNCTAGSRFRFMLLCLIIYIHV